MVINVKLLCLSATSDIDLLKYENHPHVGDRNKAEKNTMQFKVWNEVR